VAAQ
jgi:transcription elongation factor Elf1